MARNSILISMLGIGRGLEAISYADPGGHRQWTEQTLIKKAWVKEDKEGERKMAYIGV